MPTAAFMPSCSSCAHLSRAANAARRGDRQPRGLAQCAEPAQIRAAHGAFGVHVGAQKLRGVALQFGEHLFRRRRSFSCQPRTRICPPSVSTATMIRLRPDARGQPREKSAIHLAAAKRRAADDDLLRAGIENALRARRRADAAAHAHAHRRLAGRAAPTSRALLPRPMAASRSMTCSNGYFAEALQQAEDVVHGEAPLAPVHQLHGAAILQIDAGNDHVELRVRHWIQLRSAAPARLGMRESASVRRGLAPHREKSKRPAPHRRGLRRTRRENPRACPRRPRRSPARVTRSETAAVSARSKPLRVPSRSIEVSRISPAPRAAPSLAHSTASRPVGLAPAAHEGFPAVAHALGIDRQHHGLRAEFGGKFGEQLPDAAAPPYSP